MNITLPGYVIFNEFSKGAKFVTLQAARETDSCPVLIKLPISQKPTLDDLAKLRNEFDLLREMDFQKVVKPLLLEKYQNNFFLVLEDSGFETLEKIIRGHELDINSALQIAVEIVKALQGIQKFEVIHKDLQPQNILVNKKTSEVKLTGFIFSAHAIHQKLSIKSPYLIEGTLDYISPEQTGRINRDIDYRTDFYSLGAVLYELFTGVKPFIHKDLVEIIHAHIAQMPRPPIEVNPKIPKPVSDIIMKLLAKSKEERYASSQNLLFDLEHCLEEYSQKGSVEPFLIGAADVSPYFQVSQELYGRDKERATLRALLNKVSFEPPHICFIEGFSGIGKSSLAIELQRAVIEKEGFFLQGKFEQYKTGIPYSAFIQGLQELVQQILTQSEDKIVFWKANIQEALGQNAKVICDVLPDLKLIIGEPPPVPELDTEQTHNRFSLLFQLFIKSFSSAAHPVVFFLDDLQWIDYASIKLVEALMSSKLTRGLLILGAYRSNEVDPFHPLIAMQERIKEAEGHIETISLGPLQREDINRLISESLKQKPSETHELSRIVHDKTEGNPFFINQLLAFLYEDKLIRFDSEKGRWKWDIEKISKAAISENIVSLLVEKLNRTSEETRDILKIAACAGHTFDLALLLKITSYSKERLIAHLKQAINEGFLLNEGSYLNNTFTDDKTSERGEIFHFSHDRVQQAALSLLDEKTRKELHYKIGMVWLSWLSKNDIDNKIFDVVFQLNDALDIIKSPQERQKLAELNLLAGEKAMKAVAYKAAYENLKIALSLLPKDSFESNYRLVYTVSLRLAESAFLLGLFEEATQLFNQILEKCKTVEEQVLIYTLKIKLSISVAKYGEAIDNGIKALGLRNVFLDKKASKWRLLKELFVVRFKLFSYDSLSLVNLPLIEEKEKQEILDILFLLVPPSYLSTKELYALIVLTGMRLTLEWGNSAASAYFFAAYGIIMNIIFGDLKNSFIYGKIAFEICDKLTLKNSVPATKFLVGAFITPYHRPIQESIQILKESFDIGVSIGDFIYSVYSLAQLMSNQFISGLNLNEMEKDLNNYCEFVSKIKAHNRGYMFIGATQATLALKGKTIHPYSMETATFKEEIFFQSLIENNFPLSLYFIYTYKMLLLLLFKKYAETIEFAEKANQILVAVKGHPIVIEHDFLWALALVAEYPAYDRKKRRAAYKEATRILKRLRKYARYSPKNYKHKELFLEASLLSLGKNSEVAGELFSEAISLAEESQYTQYVALFNELFSEFWQRLGKSFLANHYLLEAHYNYYRWGSDAKAKEMEEKYPQLLKSHMGQGLFATGDRESLRGEPVDLRSIIKASEILSGVLALSDLLQELMKILCENSGAERGWLILEKEGKWWVEAEQSSGKCHLNMELPLDKAGLRCASSVLYYVLRTREIIALDAASKGGVFATDPYIVDNQTLSLLAFPLIHQKKLIGAVLLENNLTQGAFTPERVEVLQLLSSQMANALENALLFSRQLALSKELQMTNAQLEDYSQNLEKKVYARTHELKEKNVILEDTLLQIKDLQKKLVQQEKLVSTGTVTKAIASEIKTPLSYIYNFSKMAQELLSDLPESNDSIKMIAGNLKKIDEYAQKADEIIAKKLNLTGVVDQEKELTDINLLIRDYADLVYSNYYRKDPSFSLALETKYDASLPKVAVYPQNLGRVFYNIIDNGCYATDIKKKEGKNQNYSPTLWIKTENLGTFIQITIRDNGIGIPQSMIENIFAPFNTNKPKGKGAGMALSNSRDIITSEHQGKIDLTSKEGEYTEVIIQLPITKDSEPQAT